MKTAHASMSNRIFSSTCLLAFVFLVCSIAASQQVRRIPVVVHNLYNPTTGTRGFWNVSLVYQQMEILNRGFRNGIHVTCQQGPDAADTYIEFFLATFDKDGNPTTGIIDDTTAIDTLRPDCPQCIEADYPRWTQRFPVDKYINIVVYLLNTVGYTHEGDIVFLDRTVFGPHPGVPNYPLGHRAIHEVGHWLGLDHWGWQGIPPLPSCNCTEERQNFMSLVGDSCISEFKTSQANSMNNFLTNNRPNAIHLTELFANQRLSDATDLGDSLTVYGINVASNTAATVPLNTQFTAKVNKEKLNALKHLRWNDARDLNRMSRQITYIGVPPANDEIALFENLAPVLVDVKADGIPLDGQVDVLDPWYVDPAGSQPDSQWISYFGGFKASMMPNGGIFLNQGGPPSWEPPYYTVRVPSSQSLSISGQQVPSYFYRWTCSNSAMRDSQGTRTAVTFNSSGATTFALYKAHLRSSSSVATASNSQRKIGYINGTYHIVYESAGEIWHSSSTDNGATWSQEFLASDGTGTNRQPSLAVSQYWSSEGPVVAIAWESCSANCSSIYLRGRYNDGSWGSTSLLWGGLCDPGFEGAAPAIAMEDDFQVVAWKAKRTDGWGDAGIFYWISGDGDYHFVTGTDQ